MGQEIVRSYKREALELLPAGEGVILDVGCGTGEFSQRIARKGYDPFGIDIAREAMRRYRGRGFPGLLLDLHQSSLPFESGSFEGVWCTEVLEHLDDPEGLLEEFHRVLKPGGTLIVTCPNSYHLFYRILYCLGNEPPDLQHPEHQNFFTRRELRSLVTGAGFELTDFLGRNLFFVVRESWIPRSFRNIVTSGLEGLGFRREYSFKFDEDLFILTAFSNKANGIFADDLILRGRRDSES